MRGGTTTAGLGSSEWRMATAAAAPRMTSGVGGTGPPAPSSRETLVPLPRIPCRLRSRLAGIALVACASTLAGARAATVYLVEDLGAAEPGHLSRATAINRFGQAVGYAGKSDFSRWHAVAFTGAIERLPDDGADAEAFGIDRRGVVVGRMYQPVTQDARAFRWEQGVLQDLGTLGGVDAYATAINDAGRIVGVAQTRHGFEHPFAWVDGRMHDLGTIDGAPDGTAVATAVSADDRVAGYGTVQGDGLKHAFLWHDGVMTDIAYTAQPGFHTVAYGVNRHGTVVGMLDLFEGYDSQAFRWTPDGGFETFRPLGSGARAWALAVGDDGTVVGCSEKSWGGGLSAVVIRPGGHRLVDLNGLEDPATGKGWHLACATAVNEAGQIVGYGSHGGAYDHAFRLTPVDR
jgi:probable HAF family extracellular repeat protein